MWQEERFQKWLRLLAFYVWEDSSTNNKTRKGGNKFERIDGVQLVMN